LTAVRSYEAEQQRIEELAALDRAKSMLFSNVSHELRTPLTLLAGPLDDLLQETPDGQRKEMLVMARRNVRRLTRLVSTLMDVSRLEGGRLKGSFRPVNLGVMTRDLAALFRGAIERGRLEYTVSCDLSQRNVFVDPDHWEKIVFNLIGEPDAQWKTCRR
jgi:signal transduction histidine kinase